MEQHIKDGGPAFPQHGFDQVAERFTSQGGMTLRDYMAAQAMAGLLAGLDRDAGRFIEQQKEPVGALAQACYTMADAMLKARGQA